MLKESFFALYYLIGAMRRSKFHKFHYKNKYKGKTSSILANGPSLKYSLKEYDEGNVIITSDTFMVNLGALDTEHFFKIRPKHYCFDDPIFYRDYESKKEDIKQMYSIFNEKVDWDMNIYICYPTEEEFDSFISYSAISNPHISIVKVNRNFCSRLTKWREKFFDSGYFMPEGGTIANTALYIALLEGYSTIYLYGADHSQFLDIGVNEKNQLCSVDRHFYDAEEGTPKMKPFVNPNSKEGKVFRVHEFFSFLYYQFWGHELLRKYADFKGARVINCSPTSYVDSYERKQNSNV